MRHGDGERENVADGGMNSSYHLEPEDDVVREYSLLETVQRMTLSETHPHPYTEYATNATHSHHDFYATPTVTNEFEYDNNEYPSWDQLDQSNLDTIITDLTPEEVRWFYKSDSDKRWLEFNGYDSYRIEVEYRQYNQEWHTTYAQQYTQQGELYTFEPAEPQQQAPESPSKHQIVVRGGMYEIQRGTWFYEGTWQPVEYPHSDLIENVHLQLFCGHRLADYVDTSKTPREATGYRLLRGYKVAASAVDTDRPTNITHLVFVIHGIGQKMDTGRIIRNSNSFRDCVTWLQKKYFTKSEHRAEFFPVEWRSSLKLDGDLVQAITPLHLEKLRQLLNASAMDIMYYTSPLFGKEVSVIAHSLGCVIVYDIVTGWIPPNDTCQGHQVSAKVTARSPTQTDIICSQCSYRSHEEAAKKGKSGLLFQIENFFCLGSPLSVFLALRWQDPHKPENHTKVLPPTLCRRLMEPLLVRGYKDIAPLTLHPYNSGTSRTPYELMPLEPLQPEGSLGRRMTLGRLDFVLKEKQLTASYFAAITSHISYWEDYDVALFVLTRVFPELQEQPHNSSAESSPIKIRNLLPTSTKFTTEANNHA
ncbi:hypothetical protein B566_EDAN010296 [Ephemera danica]|nr:hypothetical protein B566_EDAN010296 [Ephemera danica]